MKIWDFLFAMSPSITCKTYNDATHLVAAAPTFFCLQMIARTRNPEWDKTKMYVFSNVAEQDVEYMVFKVVHKDMVTFRDVVIGVVPVELATARYQSTLPAAIRAPPLRGAPGGHRRGHPEQPLYLCAGNKACERARRRSRKK